MQNDDRILYCHPFHQLLVDNTTAFDTMKRARSKSTAILLSPTQYNLQYDDNPASSSLHHS